MDHPKIVESTSDCVKQDNDDINIRSNHPPIVDVDKQQSYSPKIFYNKVAQIKTWPNEICTIDIHCQQFKNKKKTKCKRQSLLISIISVLVLITLILIVVLVIATHKKAKVIKNRTAVLRWNTSGITIVGITGVGGIESNQLHVPWDIAIDWSNTLYVVDRLNNRIQKFLRNAINGTTIAGFTNGSSGSTLNSLNNPANIIVDDDDGTIYVSDESNHRVLYWTLNAVFGSILTGTTGISGYTNNQLKNPQGLSLNSKSKEIFVADYLNQRIMSYQLNSTFGTLVAGGNGPGLNDTQLQGPVAIHFDSLSNSILIANFASNNIVRWTLGESHWTHVVGSMTDLSGNTSTLFWEPSDITLDPMSNIYVVDRHNHRVQFFPIGQTEGITIAGLTGLNGNNTTQLASPTALALDSQLNLYVVDCLNHRIQKFQRY